MGRPRGARPERRAAAALAKGVRAPGARAGAEESWAAEEPRAQLLALAALGAAEALEALEPAPARGPQEVPAHPLRVAAASGRVPVAEAEPHQRRESSALPGREAAEALPGRQPEPAARVPGWPGGPAVRAPAAEPKRRKARQEGGDDSPRCTDNSGYTSSECRAAELRECR